MAKDENRSAAGLRRSAIAERLRIREEWSALKEIENNTLNESLSQRNTSIKQQPLPNFVLRFPTTGSKNKKILKKTTPKHRRRLSINEVLRGLVVHVDVGSASKALALRAALTALGATVSPTWSNLVTHLVWSDGGCRGVRARARALASRLVSPLWVEACAAAGRRLAEDAFPAAARTEDLPSPSTLRQMLKKVERENIRLNLSLENQESERNEAPRLRISSDTDTSRTSSGNKTKPVSSDRNEPDIQARINTAPRRALPLSTSPDRPTKSKRRLFTQKEDEIQKDDGSDEDQTPVRPKKINNKEMSQKKNQLNRELVRKYIGTTKTNSQHLKATQGSDRRPRIVLTGMSRQERQEVMKAIKHLNGKIQSTVNKKTTHILLGTCGPYRGGSQYYCNKCDSAEKILSQMFESNLAVHNTDNNKKQNVVCKCISLLKENTSNGRNDELNTSLLDQGRDSQEAHNPTRTTAKTDKPRTLNALLGAVRGCRILYSKWALDSLKVNRWVHHFGYEVKHMKKISEKARFERSALQKLHSEYSYNVFNGTKISISRHADQKDALTQLLRVCGARIQDGGRGDGTDSDINIGRESGEICSKWVFDSIAAGRLRTTRRYINKNIPAEVIDLSQ